MIIKGFFRRYERWNPVHPTIGAFWGMGLGLGCGVGWGPGFGPEVIGYVGAGCGVGFNVGFTFAGLGIGLPANYLFRIPYSVILAARRNAGQLGDVSPRNVRASGWSIVPHVSILHSEAVRRLSGFREKRFLEASSNLFDSKTIPRRSDYIWKSLSAFGDRVFHPHRGPRIYCKCTLEFTTPGVSNLAFGVHRRTGTIPAEQKVQHCFAQKIEEKELRAQERRGGKRDPMHNTPNEEEAAVVWTVAREVLKSWSFYNVY